MIYITNPIFATAWEVTPAKNGKYIDLQITTSEKISEDDYINSNWFPRAVGKAVNTLKELKRADRFTITKAKFTNTRIKTEDGKKSFFRFIIFEAEIEGSKRESDNTPAKDTGKKDKPKEEPATTAAEDDCPW